jgi:hypothetical protein
MDLQLLETLKQKLGSATDFGDVQSYFFDHFGEDPEFMALGEPATHPLIEATLATVSTQLFGKPVPVTGLRLVRLPEQQFIHGGFTVRGRVGSVFYFEDVQIGLAALIWTLTPPETKFVRFSGRRLQPGSLPSRN